MRKFELSIFATADELASHAASAWLDEIESARHAGKLHCVALSGGRITHKLFASFVEQAKSRKIGDGGTPALPTNVHFFWADERCVPPDDLESNFRMANEILFAPLRIPENQVHRIHGELSPDRAAELATAEIRRVISTAPSFPSPPLERGEGVGSQPVLDLIFLGMGEDGHVASLFPDAPAEIIHCAAPFLVVENSPKPPPRRISLSYAALAAARQVWALISGAGKEKALRESLDFSGKTSLGRVIQLRPDTRIFSEIRPN